MDANIFGKFHIGPDADGDDKQVKINGPTAGKIGPVFLKSCHTVREDECNAMFLNVGFYKIRALFVQNTGQDPISQIHHGNTFHQPLDAFGAFEANEAGAHNEHPGFRRNSSLDEFSVI